MQLNKTVLISMLASLALFTGSYAYAEPVSKAKAKIYTEDEFLNAFSGKSRKVVTEKLGSPVKKEQSVKPTNAAGVVGRPMDTSKPVNVEMWYYGNVVKYDPKRTYKTIEMTFVNDRCMNIAFFNSK